MLEAMVCRKQEESAPGRRRRAGEILQQLDDEMPDEEVLYDLAELFKVFGGLHTDQDFIRAVPIRAVRGGISPSFCG